MPVFSAGAEPTTPKEIRQERVRDSIEGRVRLALEAAGGELAHAKIEVTSKPGGLVMLSGWVPSPEAKTRAGQLAHYAVGVSQVDNQLEVDPSLAPPAPVVTAAPSDAGPDVDASEANPLSDEELEQLVARRIAKSLPLEAHVEHRWLRGWRVEGEGWSFRVKADEGTIRLKGRIPEPVTIDDVVASARTIAAVRSVSASLEVVDAKPRKGFFERFF
jgi:osmotically-inducible protein OsmY